MADDFKPNKKNLRERSDYGVRVARPGYDANNCAQNQLLFNSGWPILQITKVIDMRDGGDTYIYTLHKVVTKINNVTYEWEQEATDKMVDEPPEGWESTSEDPYTAEGMGGVMVNRIYIMKYVDGVRTTYSYPTEVVTEGDYTIITSTQCYKTPCVKKAHRLYYTPFFLESEAISDVEGYIVLFSVDITNDVDYPYTEGALSIVGSVGNYGINSSSIFGSKVPGLCSNMFSKLVQAVKTQNTAVSEGGDNDSKMSIWSPVDDADEAKDGCLLPYEFYAFESDFSASDKDGGDYYYRTAPWYMPRRGSSGYIRFSEAWAVASFVQGGFTKNSLVVLRSPMVSPEYEEVVV